MVKPSYKNIEDTFNTTFYTLARVMIKNGVISVGGDCRVKVNVSLKELPVKFNRIEGRFISCKVGLTSLKGFPNYIGDYLDISENDLTSLIGLPKIIKNYLDIRFNPITSIDPLLDLNTKEITLELIPNLPLLKLVSIKSKIYLYDEHDEFHENLTIFVNNARQQYLEGNKKKAILDLQKYFIEAGFIGNARW